MIPAIEVNVSTNQVVFWNRHLRRCATLSKYFRSDNLSVGNDYFEVETFTYRVVNGRECFFNLAGSSRTTRGDDAALVARNWIGFPMPGD